MLSPGGARGVKKAELTGTLIQTTTTESPQGHMYYIGLDVHKKTISYCVKDASGQVQQEGKVGATRWELDGWMKTLPHPWRDMVERFFRDLTPNRRRRGIFQDLEQLIMAIGNYIDVHNQNPKPFIWTAKANDILEKVTRAQTALNKRRSA